MNDAVVQRSLRVPENRAHPNGRTLDLDIAILPACGEERRPDPTFLLAGGPGEAAATFHPLLLNSPLRRNRDVVLVNQRGTGGSNRLACPCSGNDDDLQSYLDPPFQVEAFRACLARLEQRADLRLYSTPIAMDDLDEVREALGYERINILGGSYGSRAALVYMHRHPKRVRTAVLNGAMPMSFTTPLYHAIEAQRALDLILAQCAADPLASAAFPHLQREFPSLLDRLEAEPAAVTIPHPCSGEPTVLRLCREGFGEALRIIMYRNSRDVPLLLHRAVLGDLQPFAECALASNRAMRDALALGMLMCVSCAEDVARIDPESIGPLTKGTFLGDSRVRRQTAICDFWPRSDLPADWGEPIRHDAPVLVLSGELDPVTPPHWGEEAARHLPNSRHIVAPGAHALMGPQVEEFISHFIEQGSAEDLDATFIENMPLGPFTLPDDEKEPNWDL